MIKNILLATDGSEHALKAAKYACSFMELNPAVETTLLFAYDVANQYVMGADGALFVEPAILEGNM
ncbi:universal stress protein family protein [Heliophilum fasciatum]|uniref:Universal stress protein family protein n=1 Tax=Heliophilum fasciatum TaxID=35700 RepID=A0A4R2RUX4_9FIRM|nr:universal stress protein [Heliophilum fasciatum]MCW2277193.1 nucleotide-binding universal stress UspA family protein [Heliophilum fasciatum]TCP68172.1 universal stress protein family protein [Heliophilum fasciatum]